MQARDKQFLPHERIVPCTVPTRYRYYLQCDNALAESVAVLPPSWQENIIKRVINRPRRGGYSGVRFFSASGHLPKHDDEPAWDSPAVGGSGFGSDSTEAGGGVAAASALPPGGRRRFAVTPYRVDKGGETAQEGEDNLSQHDGTMGECTSSANGKDAPEAEKEGRKHGDKACDEDPWGPLEVDEQPPRPSSCQPSAAANAGRCLEFSSNLNRGRRSAGCGAARGYSAVDERRVANSTKVPATSDKVDAHIGERRSTEAVAAKRAAARQLGLPEGLRAGVASCLEDVCVTFRRSIRRAVLNYALLDAGQRNRLGESYLCE